MKITLGRQALQCAVPVVGLLLCGVPAGAQQSESAAPVESSSPVTVPVANNTPAALPEGAALTSGESGVRIVRLSEVKGVVSFDRRTDRGFEQAFANLPIVQGGRLQTGEGIAEVEFEDNSTLRLAPNSLVEFPVLKLGGSGARISSVHLLKGSMFVSLMKAAGNDFAVTFANQRLTLAPASHILLDLSSVQPRLAVMDGSVVVADGTRSTTVGRKKGLLFDPTDQNAPTVVASNTINVDDSLQQWDKQSVAYHNRAVGSAFRGASPYAYGVNDLSYYGSFSSIGGCGNMWQPYFASAGFDPFANGTWAYYPGSGYSFVSPYPWGWVPFHSGGWSYCQGAGWGWQPGLGGWSGLNNTALGISTPQGPRRLKPPHAPVPLGATLVAVHQKALVASDLSRPGTFVFRKDSAGLGVPRGVFTKLDKVSVQAAQRGSVTTEVRATSSAGGQSASGQSATSSTSLSRSTRESAGGGARGGGSSSGSVGRGPSGGFGGSGAGGASGGGHGGGAVHH